MGIKSKSDISNSAIRMLLQEAGHFYDEARGFKRFNTSSAEWKEVLRLFSNSCCYCGAALVKDNATNDHLIRLIKPPSDFTPGATSSLAANDAIKKNIMVIGKYLLRKKAEANFIKREWTLYVNFKRSLNIIPI